MDFFWFAIIGLLLLLFITISTLIVYVISAGLFTPISIGAGKPMISNVKFAYKFGTGAYSNVGGIFTEATSIAPDLRCLGVYYDDPKEVPEHKLRWAVGTILAEGDQETDPETEKAYEAEGYKICEFPAVENAVHSSFPHHNTMCLLIAIWRVYPRLAEYVKHYKLCAHPFLEIYAKDVMYFMAPLSKQDEFYVPEAEEEGSQEGEEDEEDEDYPGSSQPAHYGMEAEEAPEQPVDDSDKTKISPDGSSTAEDQTHKAPSSSTEVSGDSTQENEKSVAATFVSSEDVVEQTQASLNALCDAVAEASGDQVVPETTPNKDKTAESLAQASEHDDLEADSTCSSVTDDYSSYTDTSRSDVSARSDVSSRSDISEVSTVLSIEPFVLSESLVALSDSEEGNETETSSRSSFEEMSKEELQE